MRTLIENKYVQFVCVLHRNCRYHLTVSGLFHLFYEGKLTRDVGLSQYVKNFVLQPAPHVNVVNVNSPLQAYWMGLLEDDKGT